MKDLKQQNYLRSDRNIWLMVASVISGCALASSADAAIMTYSSTAPTGNVLASQLTDVAALGPGWNGGSLDGSRDYFDNAGPPGQTFTLSSAATLGAVTVQNGLDSGLHDSSAAWTQESVQIQIGSVDGSGNITPLSTETAFFPAAPATSGTEYLTLTLATPVSLSAGTLYEFSIAGMTTASTPLSIWYGIAHTLGTSDYAGGTAFNNNSSTANGPGPGTAFSFGNVVAPNPSGYDYIFELQGVPEPASMALLGLGGLALTLVRKRRRT
ncbi:MAG: PEP-CTERM sorting domain-containing protein [Verrucomicrobiota bacterium]|jgi:hypothetical protein